MTAFKAAGRIRAVVGLMTALLLMAMADSRAVAQSRALLVGVSGYPSLPEELRLTGPRNDVQLMRETLVKRGFQPERIEVLADGVAGAAQPTRNNILAALAELAGQSHSGHTVVIHFAGHGSQQPLLDAGRPGEPLPRVRLHQTFLPIDIGGWNVSAAKPVNNAILDTELRSAVERISNTDAFVFAIIDTCHSAALIRGADARELRGRQVPLRALGIAQADLDRAESAGGGSSRGTAEDRAAGGGALDTPASDHPAGSRGGTAFFYAAQSGEVTPELELPANNGPGRRRHGLFSHTVARGLALGHGMSYRQLAQYVLAEYGSMAEARVTPLFTGSALDDPVPGPVAAPLQQWPLLVDPQPAVPVGSVAGVAPGAVFAIVPGPLAPMGQSLGRLRVRSAGPFRAELELLDDAGRSPTPRLDLKPGQYARLVQTPPSLTLRVAFERASCPTPCPLDAAVAQLRRQGVPGVDVQWVARDAGADIVLEQMAQRVLLLSPTRQADDFSTKAHAAGLPLPGQQSPAGIDALSAQLASELHLAARARNLLRLAALLAAEPARQTWTARLQRTGPDEGSRTPVAPEQVAALRAGDRLVLDISNRGPQALDFTVLYLDADRSITAIFPNRPGDNNRIAAGSSATVEGIVIHAPPVGIERLLLIAVPARRHAERTDLSFLAAPSLSRRRSDGSDELDAFADVAFADFRHRGSSPAPPAKGISMQVYTLNVGP